MVLFLKFTAVGLITNCVVLFYTISYSVHIQGVFTMSQTLAAEAVSINIRAKARQRDLIDQAAARLGRSRSDFMLEAACNKAEDVLLDQAFFAVNASTFEKFKQLLDRPLPATDKLRRLLKTKAPWEK